MAVTYNPRVVTDGLVLSVDAGNTKSYNAGISTTTWTDIGPNRISGTLTNSVSSSSGYLSFNGSNQYVNFGAQTLGVSATSKTMCAWIYPTSFPSNPIGLLDMDGNGSLGGATNYGWGFWLSNAGKLWYWPFDNLDIIDGSAYSVSTNVWNFVSVAYDFSAKTAYFYYNGIYAGSGTTTAVETAPATGQNLLIGTARNATGGFYFAGRIANVSLYNRVLTAAEIKQNFNSLRGRFNI